MTYLKEPRTAAVDVFMRSRGADPWEEERRQFIQEARELNAKELPREYGGGPQRFVRLRPVKRRKKRS